MAFGDDQSAARKPSGSKVNVGEHRRRQRANSGFFYWTNFPARLVLVACHERRRQTYDANLKDLGTAALRKLVGLNSFQSPPGYPIGVYQQFNALTKFSTMLRRSSRPS